MQIREADYIAPMAKYTEAELNTMGISKNLPGHIGIIMDGNGRWAKEKGKPRIFGHRAGTERLRGIIRLSSDIGIDALSLYAFSTENWARPKSEVSGLFKILIEFFSSEIAELHANGVRIRALGDIGALPENVGETIKNAEKKTQGNSGLKLNIAINYGSRHEILRAAGRMQAAGGISQEAFENALYTAGLPELDMIIRTGGEKRLSNFLLYQAAYAELYFTDDYWPDFTDERFLDAIRFFQNRDRRFGGLK